MTEFSWETSDFILQAEDMNMKKHKFLRQKYVSGFYQSRNLLHEIFFSRVTWKAPSKGCLAFN